MTELPDLDIDTDDVVYTDKTPNDYVKEAIEQELLDQEDPQ